MDSIYHGDEVFGILKEEDSLLDTTVSCFSIGESDFFVNVTFDISMKSKSRFSKICLIFQQVVEYGFYWNDKHYHGLIASYKFERVGDLYYLSIDPDENFPAPVESDKDFLKSKKMELIPYKK